ncbi:MULTISPECIES: DUF1330 domain-containing protein [Gluconobacter]|uniref:DUF1330 domain-containing protein n=1 Tax=Gluconobacter cerinus TaxID=38307 RepID=A0A1B6VGY2_9PROT|nr:MULTISPECIES: DUF1330 domain-containing protein [Gluconobacter]MBS1020229.1 DUF1330 domain-containing protein [Gluconobacter cerinus]MBS1063943.1 DUF1330 domain-containing protein [Gluconobacter wancherniae]MBS1069969.1 DUF1330 domain-containing protein [Gluconobacter cerinus]MBS1072719.1 DUF1330 domain-containing protein [Gluconobacter cerinus]MCP1237474.1 DUF1330 domain-containing protein [Gluconobacter kondonii]
MTAYVVIVRERTTDPDALQRYRDRAPKAREIHPLTPLAFYGPQDVLEGEDAEGVAILSFASMAAARAWYASPEYQAALPHRLAGSVSRVFLVAGTDETEAAA